MNLLRKQYYYYYYPSGGNNGNEEILQVINVINDIEKVTTDILDEVIKDNDLDFISRHINSIDEKYSFEESFRLAHDEVKSKLVDVRIELFDSLKSKVDSEKKLSELSSIGFANENLTLKSNMLKLLIKTRENGKPFFLRLNATNKLLALIQELLKSLNKIFPHLESFIEFIAVLKSALGLRFP